jgi:Family of unknown function (DUF6178)
MRERLALLLEAPDLTRVVRALAPETLHQIIRHCGLDACGPLVASATREQLTTILDLDLWRSARSGCDEQFDAERFGEWLELLADAGAAEAARVVAAIDPELVVAGLSRHVRVYDPGIFEPTSASDDEPSVLELATPGHSISEIGGYVVHAIAPDAWDAIVTLLVSLEADHPDCFHAVMGGCRRLSDSAPELDGLDDLLTRPEQALHDVALARELRRSRQGYVTPADARAFLHMARRRLRAEPNAAGPSASGQRNPIAVAYFRATDEARPPAGRLAHGPRASQRVLEARSRFSHIRRLLEYLRDTDDHAYGERSRELAFLANALVAGCSIQSRAFAPQDATDAVLAACNLGLEPATPPLGFLVDHDLLTIFEAGWSTLHQRVSLFVARRLIAVLEDLECVDADIQHDLDALRIELRDQCNAETPWQARDALEVIALLDMTVWTSLLGLLDECPVIPAAMTAILERQTGAISPTLFEFIATNEQIRAVGAFMTQLPDVLRR